MLRYVIVHTKYYFKFYFDVLLLKAKIFSRRKTIRKKVKWP